MLNRFFSLSATASVPSSWWSLVKKIDGRAAALEKLSDQELRKQSLGLKYRVSCGQSGVELLIEAFALMREATHRHLGQRHFPVQILGGIALHQGHVAVMQTGEGKTLTATLPLYLAALEGGGAHLVTANDYLAARDGANMRPAFEALGLTVGIVQSQTSRRERLEAYRCDVTYSTGKEIGFDFLRDRLLARRLESHVPDIGLVDGDSVESLQPPLRFALVDEADSILIDEARTPLIISSPPEQPQQQRALFQWCAQIADTLVEREHFAIDRAHRRVNLTPAGRVCLRKKRKPAEMARVAMAEIYEQVDVALRVNQWYLPNRDYVIRDGEVLIVDEFTGRTAEGRKWRDGIHQAIEAREQLEISPPTSDAARITIQDLFRRYHRLAGMTGTVSGSQRELSKVYGMRPVTIPTHRRQRRRRLPDRIFGTDQQRWRAIAEETCELSAQGRPVLIGTRSIDKSERLSSLLSELSIDHEVLHARHVAREADIISEAGKSGRVTVATNMAGRGTDIELSQEALAAGGLHVIVSELHESSRIDRQLIGRCARQGDPGSYRVYVSFEDEILSTGFGSHSAERWKLIGQRTETQPPSRAKIFRRAQQQVEQKHYKGRRMLLFQEKQRQILQRELGQDPYLDTVN